jgi:hypothetical protein
MVLTVVAELTGGPRNPLTTSPFTGGQKDTTPMKISTRQTGLAVKASVKAGLSGTNHNRAGLVVKSAVKAGLSGTNHNRVGLVVKSAVKAGLSGTNHNRQLLA